MSEITLDTSDEVLQASGRVFDEAGLTLEEGINIFLKKVISEKKLPFELE